MNVLLSSTTLVKVSELKNARSGAYITNATVTAQLRDEDLTAVGSPITLTYESGTNATYFGDLPSSLSLTQGAKYFLDITIVFSTTTLVGRIPVWGAYYEGEENS